MPEQVSAYVAHVREATPDPAERRQALASAARYLEGLGYATEAVQLAKESEFVAPARDSGPSDDSQEASAGGSDPAKG